MSRYLEDLTGSVGGRTILAVDFGGGRQEAGFSDLAAKLPERMRLIECSPLLIDAVDCGKNGANGYVSAVIAEVEDAGLDVASIFGYCAGARLAITVAEAIAQKFGGVPSVVIFDGQIVTGELLARRFTGAVEVLRSYLSVDEFERAGIDACRAVEESVEDVERLVVRLCDLYVPLVKAASGRVGLSASAVEEMIARFSAFLRYLSAASMAEIGPVSMDVHHILSDGCKLSIDLVDGHIHRLSVPSGDLLADERTASLVAAIVSLKE